MADLQQAMKEFLAEVGAMEGRADVAEASGFVVDLYDPETRMHSIYGPFPKETATAWVYAERLESGLNADGDGPPVRCTVRLLFPPEGS